MNVQQEYQNSGFNQPQELDYQSEQNQIKQCKNDKKYSNQCQKQEQLCKEQGQFIDNKGQEQDQYEQQQQNGDRYLYQFKLRQFQKICSTLTSANQTLLDKIQQLQNQNQNIKQKMAQIMKQKQQKQNQNQSQSDISQINHINNININQNGNININNSSNSNMNRQNNKNDGINQANTNINREQNNMNIDDQRKYSQQQNQYYAQQQSQMSGVNNDNKLLQQTQLYLQQDVQDIQKLILDYRQQLKKVQQMNKINRQAYEQNLKKIQQQLQQTKNKLSETQNINQHLQNDIKQLQKQNQSLLIQIQNLNDTIYYNQQQQHTAKQSQYSQYTSTYQNNYHNNYRYPKRIRYDQQTQYSEDYLPLLNDQFNSTSSSVQYQLQRLIQKLVKQLQYERTSKKKLTSQIKRIQKDLLQSEKQIMQKNKKIYDLQMNIIRGQKNYIFNQSIRPNIQSQKDKIYQQNQSNQNSRLRKNNKIDLRNPFYRYNKQRVSNNPSQTNITDRQLMNSPITKLLYQQSQKNNSYHNNANQKKDNLSNSNNFINKNNFNKKTEQNQDKVSVKMSNINGNDNPRSQRTTSPVSQKSKVMTSFNLLQLMNDQTIILSASQKLIISLKIIQFYQKRIYVNKDYRMLMLQNIMVANFSRMNMTLMSIRVQNLVDSSQQNSKKQQTPSKAIWNLAFILNSLFVQIATKDQQIGINQIQNKILDEFERILQSKNINVKEVISTLKVFIQQAIKYRT